MGSSITQLAGCSHMIHIGHALGFGCRVSTYSRFSLTFAIYRVAGEGDVAQWLEHLTASPVMHASRFQIPLFPCGVSREAALFLSSECDHFNGDHVDGGLVELRLIQVYRR